MGREENQNKQKEPNRVRGKKEENEQENTSNAGEFGHKCRTDCVPMMDGSKLTNSSNSCRISSSIYRKFSKGQFKTRSKDIES